MKAVASSVATFVVKWFVAYPVTRAAWFVGALSAGSLILVALAIVGIVVIGALAATVAALLFAGASVVVLVAIAPIAVVPSKLGELRNTVASKVGGAK